MNEALNLPNWFQVTGTYRTRYETLDNQFRAGRTGGDQMLSFRLTARADLRWDWFGVTGEVMDSRQALADSGTPIDTSMVNTFELIQGYGLLRFEGLVAEESHSELRLGRQTIDLGSRRLVSRNGFRNTVNGFNGVHAQWQGKAGSTLRAFYLLPLTRMPSDAPSLLDNKNRFDEENLDLQFWGVFAQWPALVDRARLESYILGLHERDSADRPTPNREFYTPGLRFYRPAAKGAWDFDLEAALQFGSTRASTAAADRNDLDHFAHFQHAEAGYTFSVPSEPRLAVLWDYASGDADPADDESNRFDTLYGARRFDHGPTGIYGAFARSNIQSPGYSLGARPMSNLRLELQHRWYWLASDTDAWTTSGLRDPSGQSGSFVGHQVEASVRWDVLPKNLRLEIGAAHLFAGKFVHQAPNSNGEGDTSYGYLSLELFF